MDFKKVYFLIGVAIFMLAARQTMWAQELPVSTSAVEIMTNQPVSLEQEKDIKWAWGEVVNLDGQSGAVTLKYLDYETDQEKELVLFIDEKTTFENVVNFAELKLNDTLSIDYVVGSDNRNIAENISLENPEIVDQSVVLDLEQLPEHQNLKIKQAPYSFCLA